MFFKMNKFWLLNLINKLQQAAEMFPFVENVWDFSVIQLLSIFFILLVTHWFLLSFNKNFKEKEKLYDYMIV